MQFSQGYTFVNIVSLLPSFEVRRISTQYMHVVSDVLVSAEEVKASRHSSYTCIFISFIQCLNDVKRWGQGKDLVMLAAGIFSLSA